MVKFQIYKAEGDVSLGCDCKKIEKGDSFVILNFFGHFEMFLCRIHAIRILEENINQMNELIDKIKKYE